MHAAQHRDDVEAWIEQEEREIARIRYEAERARRAALAAEAAERRHPEIYGNVGGGRSAAPWYPGPVGELNELRRQQAEFDQVADEESRRNQWMAYPIGVAAAVPLLGEWAVLAAVRALEAEARRKKHVFTGKEPKRRGGDLYEARVGRRAHAEFRRRVEQKEGWKPDPRLEGVDGRVHIPDARLPQRSRSAQGEPSDRFVDLKPNTPSGRRAGARAVKKYSEHGKTRPVYYDPKLFR